ncbi:MAG: hypothetical protein AAF637_27045, partial [Pseudomonadota bacterium]
AAFTAAHGAGHLVAGAFADLSRLNNDGETLKLEDALNGTIKEFTYNDAAPWPIAADAGYSLVLISPASNPDPDLPGSWRSSTLPGGNPGASDTVDPPLDPLGDSDGNGLADLIDHALGNDLGVAAIAPTITLQPQEVSPGVFEERPTIAYTISLGAETTSATVKLSTDLATWDSSPADLSPVSSQNLGDGRALVTAYVNPPLSSAVRLFYRLEVSN